MIKKTFLVFGLVVGLSILGYSIFYWDDFKRSTPDVIAILPMRVSQPVLIRMMTMKDEIIAQEATYQVGKIGGQASYVPLLRAIDSPIPMVRHNAINAMIYLNQQDLAADATIRAIANPREESYVIDSALALLFHLTDPVKREKAARALQEYSVRASYPRQRDTAQAAVQALK